MKIDRTTVYTLGLSLCVAATSSTANAQSESLEQSYARLCGNGQKGETCDALRSAMLKKLGGGTSSSASSSANTQPSASMQRWGFWADLAGTSWLNSKGVVYTYAWQTPGQTLLVEVMTPTQTYTGVWTPAANGSFNLQIGTTVYPVQRLSDGSFVQFLSDKARNRYSMAGGALTLTEEERTANGWQQVHTRPVGTGALSGMLQIVEPDVRRRLQPAEVSQHKNALAQKQAAAKQQVAQQQQQKQAPKRRGGLFGAMKGAVAGAYGVANAGGGSSEALVGGAVGAVAGGAGVDAEEIASSMGAATQTTATASAAASGSSSGGAAPSGASRSAGSYPTKPNALAGQPACSMMNESNYRQVGLSGGNDVQLKTMCAQAYEYYVMYKRAISQGYAEADANRTYHAHQQSAKVAISFYNSAR